MVWRAGNTVGAGGGVSVGAGLEVAVGAGKDVFVGAGWGASVGTTGRGVSVKTMDWAVAWR
jgi:hypothetical protein